MFFFFIYLVIGLKVTTVFLGYVLICWSAGTYILAFTDHPILNSVEVSRGGKINHRVLPSQALISVLISAHTKEIKCPPLYRIFYYNATQCNGVTFSIFATTDLFPVQDLSTRTYVAGGRAVGLGLSLGN